MVLRLHRPLRSPQLIVTGDRHRPEGLELGAELWRVPFPGWGRPACLVAEVACVPRRFAVVDEGLVRAAGYTSNHPTCLPGETFTLRLEERQAA